MPAKSIMLTNVGLYRIFKRIFTTEMTFVFKRKTPFALLSSAGCFLLLAAHSRSKPDCVLNPPFVCSFAIITQWFNSTFIMTDLSELCRATRVIFLSAQSRCRGHSFFLGSFDGMTYNADIYTHKFLTLMNRN